jgi:uncharacterized protein
MFEFMTEATWSPYIAGAGIGVLVCLAFLLSNRPIGCSTGFVKAGGLIGKIISPEHTRRKEYYHEIVPEADWAFMLIPGIVIGAFLSSMLSGQFQVIIVPATWDATFGNTPVLRIIVAILGGALIGIGARWAGGCTAGHGISGSIQLSLASMITAVCFFAGGIGMAMFLFYVIGGV